MMIFLELFLAFLVPGIIGYGGGPASIPLFKYEVVNRYHMMTGAEFAEVVAAINIFPGVAATKIAGSIGYIEGSESMGFIGGIIGAAVAVLGVVAPSLILMIVLLSLLTKYKDSFRVKRLTNYVKPAITVLLGLLAYGFFQDAYRNIEVIHLSILTIASFILLQKLKLHPAIVIIGALVYGAFFIR